MALSDAELYRNRRVQDAQLSHLQRGFDRSAPENHMKYERKYFAVVGEGTKSAFTAYRRGYDRIDWKR